MAILDPPRPEVARAIKDCKRAGINVIMITGDIKETAQTIAKDTGIVKESEIAARSFSGADFENL